MAQMRAPADEQRQQEAALRREDDDDVFTAAAARGVGNESNKKARAGLCGVLRERKVVDLARAKRRLVEVPYTATLAHTANALLAARVSAVAVAAPPGHWISAGGSMILESDPATGAVRKHYIGMVNMLDILAHIAEASVSISELSSALTLYSRYWSPMSATGSPNPALAMCSIFAYGTTWISTPPSGRNTAFVSPAPCSPTAASPRSCATKTSNPAASAARATSGSFRIRR